MVNLFRSFFLISLFVGSMGIFMLTLVHVMSEPRPGFAIQAAPASYFIKTVRS